ncbi:MAG: diguanylate cyclase [Candidatus Omnitrophica bacterium]|nr:diguanylate cyclase [Candidatus Omnitrophota bacterium]
MDENLNLQCQEVISICDSIDQVIYITDPDTYEVLFANKALKKDLGEVVGKKCYEVFQGLDSPCPFCTNKYIFGENLGKTYIWEFQNRNDKRWYHCIDKAIRWTDGRWVRYEMAIDINERKRSNEELQRQQEELQTIFDSVPAMIFYKDKQNRMLRVNNAFAKVMGRPKEEIEGKTCSELWSGEQAEKYFSDDKEVIESGLARLDIIERLETTGGVRWVCTQKIPYRDKDGNVIGVLGFATDITERKQSKEEREILNKELLISNKRLKRLSLRDPQTGLYNHLFFQEVIETEFHRAKRYAHNLSVIMLDLDYFKSINDVYGHLFGDLVLKQFARLLKRMVRGYDIVVRYGGEEFVIISPATTRASALVLAQRIMEAINLYNFGNKKNTVKLKLSLAVAAYPENHILNGMELVKLTDQILNKAKESGGNRVYSSLDLKKGKTQDLENDSKSSDVKFLKEKLEKLTKRANQNLIEATFAFAKTIDLKDHYTGEHVEKTVHYATEIASLLGLPKNDIEVVKQASILHDLGKIGISEKILLKKSKLTKEELKEVRRHPRIGVEIIRPIHFLHSIVPLMLYHHERWDGKGYPYGLKGEEIPIGARIIAIADVFQALISDRPYHKAYSEDEAVSIIKDGSGTQFDPHVVITFLKILKRKN